MGAYPCVFFVNARSVTCKSLQTVWGLGLMPSAGCSSFPYTHLQDASEYLHLAHLIIVCGEGAPATFPLPETSGSLW